MKKMIVLMICVLFLITAAFTQHLEDFAIPQASPFSAEVKLPQLKNNFVEEPDDSFSKRATEYNHPTQQYDYSAHVPPEKVEQIAEVDQKELKDQLNDFLSKLYIRYPKKFANLVIFPIGFKGIGPEKRMQITKMIESKLKEGPSEEKVLIDKTQILDSVFETGDLLFFPLITLNPTADNLLKALNDQLIFPELQNEKSVKKTKETITNTILKRRTEVTESLKALQTELKKDVQISTEDKELKHIRECNYYSGYLKDGEECYSFAYNKNTRKLVEIPNGSYEKSGPSASETSLRKIQSRITESWKKALKELDSDKDYVVGSAREAVKSGNLKVTETGKMGEFKLTNTTGKPLLLIEGEYSPGCSPSQHRITAKSTIIPPHANMEDSTSAAGFCSQPGKVIAESEIGSTSSTPEKPMDTGSGIAPVEIRSTIMEHAFRKIDSKIEHLQSESAVIDTPDSAKSLKIPDEIQRQQLMEEYRQDENRQIFKNARDTQFSIWSQFRRLAAELGEEDTEYPSMESLLKSKEQLTALYNKAISFKKNTVGVIVFVDGMFLVADIFNQPSAFAARKDALIKSYAFTAARKLTLENLKNGDFAKKQYIEKSADEIFKDLLALFEKGDYQFQISESNVFPCQVRNDIKKASVLFFGDQIPHISVFNISKPEIKKVINDRVVLSFEGSIHVMKENDEIKDCFQLKSIKENYVEFYDLRSRETYRIDYN